MTTLKNGIRLSILFFLHCIYIDCIKGQGIMFLVYQLAYILVLL